MVVASADPRTRPVLATAEALLEYASGGRTDNDCKSAQWCSAEKLRQSNWATVVGYRIMVLCDDSSGREVDKGIAIFSADDFLKFFENKVDAKPKA